MRSLGIFEGITIIALLNNRLFLRIGLVIGVLVGLQAETHIKANQTDKHVYRDGQQQRLAGGYPARQPCKKNGAGHCHNLCDQQCQNHPGCPQPQRRTICR